MAHHFTIARPYARAVFEEAVATEQVVEWSLALTCFSMIASDEMTQRLLRSPKLTNTQREELFIEVAVLAAPSVSHLRNKLQNFIRLICAEKRFSVLSDIDTLFNELVAVREGKLDVVVTSAKALTEQHKKQLEDALMQRMNVRVDVKYKENQELIGGAVIRAGNWVMDGSMKGQLSRLRDALCS